jgi:hypothetical protein
MENKGYMPVKDMAEKRGTTVQAIYQAAKRGKYLVKKIGTYTLVKQN